MVANVKTSSFTDAQAAVWRKSCGVKMTDAEFAGVVEFARARNLNPHAGHFVVQRRGKSISTVTTIDGFRAIASMTGALDGQEDAEWRDDKGQWHDVWASDKSPVAARVRVYRKGCSHPFTAVAHHRDYSPGTHGWWGKSGGAHMLAKCAEALALRKAFPEALASIYTHDEMGQADSGPELVRPSAEKTVVVEEPAPVVAPPANVAVDDHPIIRFCKTKSRKDAESLWDELKVLGDEKRRIAIRMYKAHTPHLAGDESCECAAEAQKHLEALNG